MRKLFVFAALLLVFETPAARSQKIINQQLYWLKYYNQVKFNERFTLGTEIEERRYMNPDRIHQRFLPMVHLSYHITPQWTANVGFVFFQQFLPHNPKVDPVLFHELRPHQFVSYRTSYNRLSVKGRLMLEERFFELPAIASKDYHFNFRERNLIRLDYKLVDKLTKKEGSSLSLFAYEEAMFNFGNVLSGNTFDQNRIGIGTLASLGPRVGIEMSFFNWFQPTALRDEYFSRYILHFVLIHRISV